MLRPVTDGRKAPEIVALASGWAQDLARAVCLPLTRAELTSFLIDAAAALAQALAVDPPDLDAARQVGISLVDADLVAPDVLPATVEALGRHLLRPAGSPDVTLAVQRAVVDGYATRLRRRILDEQETLREAEVQARTETEDALRASEAQFRAIFANAGLGIGIADMQGRMVEVNTSFASMLGYSVEEFGRLTVDDFVEPVDAAGMWYLYAEIIEGKRDVARVEKRYRHRDGHYVWTDLTASLIRDATGAPLYTVAMAEDITVRRQLQERLRHQALHDPLTLLPNRALFQDRLTAAFTRPGGRVGICYLDLDRFKVVNDRHGHDVGDALLVEVAARLDRCVSIRGHLVARMGGDEFVVLLEEPPTGELALVADRVLAELAEPIRVGRHRFTVSASIGVVESGVGDTTPADVLRAADVTLYWAKSDGRNRWARFDAERNAHDMDRYLLSESLLPGLERDEFRVEYQPIVHLHDGSTCGVEALVRWQHPTLGRLGPDLFIDLAEESGAIVGLGRRVLTRACERGAAWNAAHPGADLFISVNLAVRQAQEPDLVDDVAQILASSGLPASLLQLELTESALLGPAGRPVEAITALADTGVRIAVDDFGTGYSNLGYLPRLPLSTLKLAGVFVDGLRSPGSGHEPVVAGLIAMAHSIGLTVTAEGVETPAQADQLRAAGCDTAQGWLYARSAPWEDLVELLLPTGR